MKLPILLLFSLGLACSGLPGRPEPVPVSKPLPPSGPEVLNLAKARWGIDIPNDFKGIALAFDGKRAYVAARQHVGVYPVEIANGHPTEFWSLDASAPAGANVAYAPILVADASRSRIWWVDSQSGALGSLNTANGGKEGFCPSRAKSQVLATAVDPATGVLWLGDKTGLRGFTAGVCTPVVAPAVGSVTAITALPAGDALLLATFGTPSASPEASEAPPRGADEARPAQPRRPRDGAAPRPRARPGQPGGVSPKGAGGPPRGGEQGRSRPSGGGTIAFQQFTPSTNTLVPVVGPLPPVQQGTPRPYRGLGADNNGNVFAMADVVLRFAPGLSKPTWVWRAPEKTMRMLVAEGLVLVLTESVPLLTVYALDPETGAVHWQGKARYESRWLAAGAGQVMVANGGDGSISVLDAKTGSLVTVVDVSNTAESAVVDTKTGTRYIASRLGGSLIHVWKPGESTVTDWPVDNWPAELGIDVARRRLYALIHYTGTVAQWDLDSGARLADIALGVPANTSDTMGDFDARGGYLAASFPEAGFIGVSRDDGSLLWSKEVSEFRMGPEQGPGHGMITIDPEQRLVYAAGGEPERLRAFSLETGEEKTSVDLSADSPWRLNRMYFDAAGRRIFVGQQVFAAGTLQTVAGLPAPMKVVGQNAQGVYAQKLGDNNDELLVRLDPRTLAEVASVSIGTTGTMRLEATITETQAVVSDMLRGEVRVIPLP